MPFTDVRVLLARNMKHHRAVCGLSQMALAGKIGCSTTLIANIETLNRFPSANMFNRIADALKVSPSALLADADSPLENRKSFYEVREQLEEKIKEAIDDTLKIYTDTAHTI